VDVATVVLRAEPFDGPAGSRLVADLTADLGRRYADEDEPPQCSLPPEERAARQAAIAADEAAYAAELSPEDVAPPGGAFLVAYVGGDAVGCAGIRAHEVGVAEIKRLWVDPGARGLGVARALVSRLEEDAVRLGYRALVLETGLRQPEAIALYESLGYRRREPYGRYRDSPLSVCLERDLPAGAVPQPDR
jgi:GNAT superfamily N-acetyltransferase